MSSPSCIDMPGPWVSWPTHLAGSQNSCWWSASAGFKKRARGWMEISSRYTEALWPKASVTWRLATNREFEHEARGYLMLHRCAENQSHAQCRQRKWGSCQLSSRAEKTRESVMKQSQYKRWGVVCLDRVEIQRPYQEKNEQVSPDGPDRVSASYISRPGLLSTCAYVCWFCVMDGLPTRPLTQDWRQSRPFE